MPDRIQLRDIRGRVGFAVITIRSDEFEAVLDRFPDRRTAGGGKQLYEYATVANIGGGQYGVAVVRSLEQGQTSAQSLTRDVIDDLDPGWLILAGIAGAAPDRDFSLGDVCLASRLHDFSVSAAIEGKQPTYEQTGGPMHRDVERLLRWLPAGRDKLGSWNSEEAIGLPKPTVKVPKRLDSRLLYGPKEVKEKLRDSLARHFPSDGTVRPPLFHVGPGATSGTLVRDTTLLERWQESARHLTHVEMEAGGAYDAARHGGHREYPLLCVRGISDVVGLKRDPAWTKYACHSAASFLRALLVHAPGDSKRTGPTLAAPPPAGAPMAAGHKAQPSSVPGQDSIVPVEPRHNASDLTVTQRRDSAVYQRSRTGEVWLEAQELFADDVFEIAKWSGARAEAEKMVFAVQAVRHGLNKETAKRFYSLGNLRMFVELLEEVISRCVEKIPQQATKEHVRRAFSVAIDDLGLAGSRGTRRKGT